MPGVLTEQGTSGKVVGLLLAAGAGRRFGPDGKLLADLDGAPLVAHAAGAMAAAKLSLRIAVISRAEVAAALPPGFKVVRIPPGGDMATSIRAGLAAAGQDWDRLLIALGDMPRVSAAHLDRVVATATDDRPAASAVVGRAGRHLPPACFPPIYRDRLAALDGDAGARDLIATLPGDAIVAAPASSLMDVDSPNDLPRALPQS